MIDTRYLEWLLGFPELSGIKTRFSPANHGGRHFRENSKLSHHKKGPTAIIKLHEFQHFGMQTHDSYLS